jgi:Arc/MetJ family transcription regulator
MFMARTNVELDDRLVRQGMRRFKCKSKRELVHLALTELLRDAKRKELLTLRGQVRWEGNLDEMRRGRP